MVHPASIYFCHGHLIYDLLCRCLAKCTLSHGLGSIFLSPDEDHHSIAALDFLQIYAVMRALRSPIYTVALGMLRSYETLLLAAGQQGHRHILDHSLICLDPFTFDGLPSSEPSIGMMHQGTTLPDQTEKLLRTELDSILHELELEQKLFQFKQIVSAAQAIRYGIADSIVPIVTSHRGSGPRSGHRLAT
jgi:hypothetical protein